MNSKGLKYGAKTEDGIQLNEPLQSDRRIPIYDQVAPHKCDIADETGSSNSSELSEDEHSSKLLTLEKRSSKTSETEQQEEIRYVDAPSRVQDSVDIEKGSSRRRTRENVTDNNDSDGSGSDVLNTRMRRRKRSKRFKGTSSLKKARYCGLTLHQLVLTGMWIFLTALLLIGLVIFLVLEHLSSHAQSMRLNEAAIQSEQQQRQRDSEHMLSKAFAADLGPNQGWRFDRKIQDCQSTALKQTFPNIDYSLYGYNILLGYPLHDGKDPGFTRPIFSHNFTDKRFTADCRYSIPRGVTVAPDVSCVTSFTSTVVQSSYDFQRSLSTHAKASGGGWGVSFSASAGYQETESIISSGQTKVILSTAHCNQYFTKFNWFEPPDFSAEMVEWIRKAKNEYKRDNKTSDNSIYQLFEYFGTHLPVETLYGARYTFEHRLDSSKLGTASSTKFSAEIEASVSAFGFSGGLGIGMSQEQKEAAQQFRENVETRTISVGAPPPYNGDAMTWASTVKDNPVPVSTSLEPIYSIFDKTYMAPTIISEEFAEHLKSRIEALSRQYCRDAQKKGIKVECIDRSVLEFPGLQGEHTPSESYDAENENSCVDECHKRLECVMASWVVETDSKTCRLYNLPTNHPTELNTPYFHPNTCNDAQKCSIYILQTRIVEAPLHLRGVRYRTGQRNKLKLKATPRQKYNKEFEEFSSICSYLCSKDALCIAYEVVAGDDKYSYSCATSIRHNIDNFKKEENDKLFNYDVQLLSKKSKQKVLEKVHDMEFIMPCGSFSQMKSFKISGNDAHDSCQQKCTAKSVCTSFSYKGNTTECTTGISKGVYTYETATPCPNTFKVFPQKELRGWMNITNLEIANICSERKTDITTEENCAKACLGRVDCHFASFCNEECRLMKADTSPEDIAAGCFSFRDSAKLFLPNYDRKLEHFESLSE